MAPLTKRSKSDDIPQSENPFLPEHILDHMIVPRLPFKTLKRFQCVSSRYRFLIGHDPIFHSEQARLLSPSSNDLVQLSGKGLSFLINAESIGVPDPSLKFLGYKPATLRLLCSTNGLLLLYGNFKDSDSHICLCNPATQEKLFVPTTQSSLLKMGLAYDPCITPNQYILVSLHLENTNIGRDYEYKFDIFRSDTVEWSRSNKKVRVNYPFDLKKIVHTQGVIYWRFSDFILWYNTEKDLAGSVPLPTTEGYWRMGVYAGEVVCCHTWLSGVEVWRLTNGTHWDRLHFIGWGNLPLKLSRGWMMRSIRWRNSSGHFKSRQFHPLAFDGQSIYLLNFPKPAMFVYCAEMLGYNICTQQIEKKGVMNVRGFDDDEAYEYHNSMAPLPKILG